MGSAIVRGVLQAGIANIHIVDPDVKKLKEFKAIGVSTSLVCTHVNFDDILMLAIPPQVFPSFAADVTKIQAHQGLVISVMAGVTIKSIQAALNVQQVIRAIPNTPSEVFEGMTLYCKSDSVDGANIETTGLILGAIGQYIELPKEDLIDSGTALCGGGPAFVAYFANALQKFGEQAGIGEYESR